jgi:hypothetical protein
LTKPLPELRKCANGADHLSTLEFALAVKKQPQTIRKNYCLNGHCYGIRPLKVGNALLWPVADIEQLLNGGAV